RLMQKWLSLAVAEPQRPDVKPSSGMDFHEGQHLPIGGPRHRNMGVLTGCQSFQPPTAVCPLPENVQRSILVRVKRYPLAVRCPYRVQVRIPFKRASRERLTREIVQP